MLNWMLRFSFFKFERAVTLLRIDFDSQGNGSCISWNVQDGISLIREEFITNRHWQ
jgi:hypothetical protein